MPAADRVVLYLAYGANMSSRKLRERGVTTSDPGRPAVARDKTVSFSHRGGFATLLDLDTNPQNSKGLHIGSSGHEQPLGIVCHGVVYSLTEGNMRRLSRVETGYRRASVAVVTYGEQWLEAEVFVSQPSLVLKAAVPPTERYLTLMREGAREHGLKQDYLSWLDGVQPWDGYSHQESRFDTPSAAYANIGLACTFGAFIALSLVFLH
jgi:hypothetical protein